jgi:hypothetical protein
VNGTFSSNILLRFGARDPANYGHFPKGRPVRALDFGRPLTAKKQSLDDVAQLQLFATRHFQG